MEKTYRDSYDFCEIAPIFFGQMVFGIYLAKKWGNYKIYEREDRV